MLATWGPKQGRYDPLTKAGRLVCWFSCGAASACATKLALMHFAGQLKTHICYCDTGSEHPDNARFLKDCEVWFEHPITVLKHEKYETIYDVFRDVKYIKHQHGAPCTDVLKKEMRRRFEQFDDCQVFGFDTEEQKRHREFCERNPEVMTLAPLVEFGLSKDKCFSMLSGAGIDLPSMYKLGYRNNNCLGCVKGGMGYWNKIRRDFPDTFEAMAKLERELGFSINSGEHREGKKRVKDPVFLDELDPERGDYGKEPSVSCGATGCNKE